MMSLSQVGLAIDALEISGEANVHGVSTDTRYSCAHKLFVALRGSNFDGHDFLQAAANANAAAVMVDRPYDGSLPAVRVKDATKALLDLAGAWRDQYPVPVIGVTGSAGKTTVKEMLAAILSQTGSGVVTKGNLNNHIGVPLTLTRLSEQDQYAVVEMGMNHRGEISRLAQATRPNVAVITNAGAAHLEGLESVEEVARAKAEIFDGLGDDGIAIINADDQFCGQWCAAAGSRKQVTFGTSSKADIYLKSVETGQSVQKIVIKLENKELIISLPISGLHNALNAAAATAATRALGISHEQIVTGLESFEPVVGRSRRLELNGITLVDDSYNANPLSMAAAVDMVLAQKAARRILVLGDMAELGEEALKAHAALGRYIADQPISLVYAVGELMQALVSELGKRGRHFDNKHAMFECLGSDLKSGDVVLIKGSRAARMDEVVDELVATFGGNTNVI